nr:MAG TPA: hypothetical protein [Caudoviricetes sp.]
MCETCQGHFFLQNNVDGTFRHFLLQSAFQILLDGFPGSQTPHAAVSLNEADTPVTDANQEDALRLLDLLEGTIGPELHQRADLLVGLERYSLLSGNSGGDPVIVVDHLGAQRDVADQLHGIERIRRFLEAGAECDLGFLKTEGGLCLPTGNVCGVCFIIDLPEAALVIIFGLAEAADSLAVRNGDVQRGVHLACFGSDHRYQRVQTVQVQRIRMEDGRQQFLDVTVAGNAECGAVDICNERLRGLLDVFDKFFQHGVVSSSGKFNEFERRGCFLFGSGNSELAGDLRDHLHNIFLVGHIQHGGHSVCGRQSGFDRIADADILSAVIRFQFNSNGDLALGRCRGVGIHNVRNRLGHLEICDLQKTATGHLQNGFLRVFIHGGSPPFFRNKGSSPLPDSPAANLLGAARQKESCGRRERPAEGWIYTGSCAGCCFLSAWANSMKQILDALGTMKIRNHGINLTVSVRIDSATLGADMGRVAVQINGEGSILAASAVQHHRASPLRNPERSISQVSALRCRVSTPLRRASQSVNIFGSGIFIFLAICVVSSTQARIRPSISPLTWI